MTIFHVIIGLGDRKIPNDGPRIKVWIFLELVGKWFHYPRVPLVKRYFLYLDLA